VPPNLSKPSLCNTDKAIDSGSRPPDCEPCFRRCIRQQRGVVLPLYPSPQSGLASTIRLLPHRGGSPKNKGATTGLDFLHRYHQHWSCGARDIVVELGEAPLDTNCDSGTQSNGPPCVEAAWVAIHIETASKVSTAERKAWVGRLRASKSFETK
jgi:hypothetical protein